MGKNSLEGGPHAKLYFSRLKKQIVKVLWPSVFFIYKIW